MALDEGAVLVQLPRAVFLAFIADHPKTLQVYLEQGLSRLWRVANFILSDYLALQLPSASGTLSSGGEGATAQYGSRAPEGEADGSERGSPGPYGASIALPASQLAPTGGLRAEQLAAVAASVAATALDAVASSGSAAVSPAGACDTSAGDALPSVGHAPSEGAAALVASRASSTSGDKVSDPAGRLLGAERTPPSHDARGDRRAHTGHADAASPDQAAHEGLLFLQQEWQGCQADQETCQLLQSKLLDAEARGTGVDPTMSGRRSSFGGLFGASSLPGALAVPTACVSYPNSCL